MVVGDGDVGSKKVDLVLTVDQVSFIVSGLKDLADKHKADYGELARQDMAFGNNKEAIGDALKLWEENQALAGLLEKAMLYQV